jgi:Disaggregatase related
MGMHGALGSVGAMRPPMMRWILSLGAMALALAVVVVITGHAGAADHLAAPRHLQTSTVGKHRVLLGWKAPAGARRYGLWRQGVHVATTRFTSYAFGGLSCGRSYRLGARALFARGGRSAIAWVTARTGACPPPRPACTRVIGPGQNIAMFVAGLTQGEVGCLKSGRYAGRIVFVTPGVTLQPAPDAAATCSPCEVEIRKTATSVTWDGVGLNATAYPFDVIALHIYGDDALVENSNIQNGQDICVIVGSETFGVAHRTRIVRNRIHNCGSNHVWNEETIYLEATRDAVVRDNTLYDAADFELSMYDDVQGSVIEHNILDGARTQGGLVFGSTDVGQGYCSVNNANVVTANIISNNHTYAAMDNPSDCAYGQGNVVARNCTWNNRDGNFSRPLKGFTASDNTNAPPGYVDRAAGDYHLLPGSACAGDGPRP